MLFRANKKPPLARKQFNNPLFSLGGHTSGAPLQPVKRRFSPKLCEQPAAGGWRYLPGEVIRKNLDISYSYQIGKSLQKK